MGIFFYMVIIFSWPTVRSQKIASSSNQKIVVVIQDPKIYQEDSMMLHYCSIGRIALDKYTMNSQKKKINNGYAHFTFNSKIPLTIFYEVTGNDGEGIIYISRFFEPGDSIHIDFKNNKPVFSGRGVEKFQIMEDYKEASKTIPQPNRNITSIKEFLDQLSYTDKWTKMADDLLAIYKNKISSFAFDYFKLSYTASIEKYKWEKFGYLLLRHQDIMGLNSGRIADVFDSLANSYSTTQLLSQDARALHVYNAGLMSFYHEYLRALYYKTIEFNLQSEAATSHVNRARGYYQLARQNLKGLFLEDFLLYFIDEEMDEYGFTPAVEELLFDYYSRLTNPIYLYYAREREIIMRTKHARRRRGGNYQDIILLNEEGQQFSTYNLKGKIILFNFWKSGSRHAEQLVPVWQRIQNQFKNDNNVVFVNVSGDDYYSTWKVAILEKKFVSDRGMQFFAGGVDVAPKLLKEFGVFSYPTILVRGYSGNYTHFEPRNDPSTDPIPDILKDNGDNVIRVIKEELQKGKKYSVENPGQFTNIAAITGFDGPYVLYDKDSAKAYSFIHSELDIKSFPAEKVEKLKASTDNADIMFSFPLKKFHSVERSDYPRPEKMLVLSDIEGQFKAFRKLLQANNIIDDNYNWIFGNGHLVFAGDMFDRGEQVTECLWLIYSLEEKAKAAGGYVHFVLGNHEIMNLSGNFSYVQNKYKLNAQRMNKSYRELYNENSELGRWLRTKNIVERIGDLLFLHGGISPHINKMSLTLQEINETARPFYANSDSATKSGREAVKTLYHSYKSPFWYRYYYQPDHYSNSQREFFYHATKGQLDSTCLNFGVDRIVTGHTIVADTISVHHGGRVINTDTKHAAGKSEALLIEGDKFYRVNGEGKRVLLFIDDKKKITTGSTTTNIKTEK